MDRLEHAVHPIDLRIRELPTSRIHEIIRTIAAVDEFKGMWHARSLSASLLSLRQRTEELSATASLRIADGGWRVRSGGVPAVASLKSPELAAYAQTLRWVFDGFERMTLAETLLSRLHERMLRHSHEDQTHRGRYRVQAPEGRRQRSMEAPELRPLDPHLVPQAVAELLAWTHARLDSGEIHPLLISAAFVLEFMAIRPFENGNGRLSRLLTNLLLMRCGYTYAPYASLEQIISERWAEYYMALRKSQASRHLPRPDITPWVCAFLDALRAQALQLRRIVDGQPDDSLLSENQLSALRLLQRGGEATNRRLCAELNLPRETVKQILNRLLTLGFVRRVGAGRAIRYRLR
jgi:Fic family protein